MVAELQKTTRYSRKKVLEFPWSDYQRSVFNALQEESGHLMVGAVAGSGKTKTIEGIVASTPVGSKVAVLAFNNHIVDELKHRIPQSIATVTTAHRMGLTMLVRFFGGETFQPNDRKYRGICQRLINELQAPYLEYWRIAQESPEEADRLFPVPPPNVVNDSSEGKAYRKALTKHLEQLVHFCQITLTDSDPESLRKMAEHYSLMMDEDDSTNDEVIEQWIFPLVRKALDIGVKEAIDSRNVGLDDLIWLPNHLDIKPPQKQFVIVDEAQDSNRAIVGLYMRSVQDGGKLILLGDKFQAIMGFAGSDSNAWDRLKEETNARELPLSICYRCPSSHLDVARAIVPQIKPRDNAPEGTIEVLPPREVSALVQPGDLIVCRFTSPLISLCLKLIVQQKKAKVRGRDIGKSLTALAKQACESAPYPKGFMEALQGYCRPRIDLLKENGEELQAQNLEDKQMALKTCFESFGLEVRNLNNFCQMVEDLFCEDGDRPPIVLSTIHRAKGDESDRVFLLGSNSLPFTAKVKHRWQAVQEVNLLYVALTRAKQSLFLVPLPDRQGNLAPSALEHPLGGINLPDGVEPEEVASTPTEPDRSWLPQVGETVHKRYYQGWSGTVLELVSGDRVRVQWLFDPSQNLYSIAELRPEGSEPEGERFKYQKRKEALNEY